MIIFIMASLPINEKFSEKGFDLYTKNITLKWRTKQFIKITDVIFMFQNAMWKGYNLYDDKNLIRQLRVTLRQSKFFSYRLKF